MNMVKTVCPQCSNEIEVDISNGNVPCPQCGVLLSFNTPIQSGDINVHIQNALDLIKQGKLDDAYKESEIAKSIDPQNAFVYVAKVKLDIARIHTLDISKEIKYGMGLFFPINESLRKNYTEFLRHYKNEDGDSVNPLASEKQLVEDYNSLYERNIDNFRKVAEINSILSNFIKNSDYETKRGVYLILFSEVVDETQFDKAIVTAQLKMINSETEYVIQDLDKRGYKLDTFKNSLLAAIEKDKQRVIREAEENEKRKHIFDDLKQIKQNRIDMSKGIDVKNKLNQNKNASLMEIICFIGLALVASAMALLFTRLVTAKSIPYYEMVGMVISGIIASFIVLIINMNDDHSINIKKMAISVFVISWIISIVIVLFINIIMGDTIVFSNVLIHSITKSIVGAILSTLIGSLVIKAASFVGSNLVSTGVKNKINFDEENNS